MSTVSSVTSGPPGRLAPEVLLHGFLQAVSRFTTSGVSYGSLSRSEPDHDLDRLVLTADWATAVFEALNWSVTLEERLRHDLPGIDWTGGLKGGGVVRALRYARNCVHHNWAAALKSGLQEHEMVAAHATVLSISWVAELHSERTDRRGAAAYAENLAGRRVGDSLLEAAEVYETAVKFLAKLRKIVRPADELSPVEGQSLALYHHVYRDEGFDHAARALFDLVADSQRTWPGVRRALFLDVEGHRTASGGFDDDMFELQKEFILGYLAPFLTEVHLPLITARRARPQRNNLPQELLIHSAL